jgi:type I restriction enzyme R subunit
MTKNKITESETEKFAIELLEKQGYQYIYAPDIAPDSETPQRSSFEDILLLDRLRKAVGRIHRMLTEGIKVSYHKDGADRGDLVWLIDFNNPQNNEFLVTNQFTIIENEVNKRPASSNKYTGCGPNEFTCSLRRHRSLRFGK